MITSRKAKQNSELNTYSWPPLQTPLPPPNALEESPRAIAAVGGSPRRQTAGVETSIGSQASCSVSRPTQKRPPFVGAGAVHSRVLVRRHVDAEHSAAALHVDHTPATTRHQHPAINQHTLTINLTSMSTWSQLHIKTYTIGASMKRRRIVASARSSLRWQNSADCHLVASRHL